MYSYEITSFKIALYINFSYFKEMFVDNIEYYNNGKYNTLNK